MSGDAWGDQKRVFCPVELEFQAFMKPLLWHLGSELQYSLRAVQALGHRAICTALTPAFLLSGAVSTALCLWLSLE